MFKYWIEYCPDLFQFHEKKPINYFALSLTAYGISPDRNLRDKQCTMRINARANPPTAPQFSLPSQPPSKCLDISTNSNNKAEENSDSENSKSINNAKKKWLNLKTAAGVREETNKSPDDQAAE